MRNLILILACALMYTAPATAKLTSGSTSRTDLAWQLAESLNSLYPGLNLNITASADEVNTVIGELNLLDLYLQGELALKDGELKTIACSHRACGGGDDGCDGPPPVCRAMGEMKDLDRREALEMGDPMEEPDGDSEPTGEEFYPARFQG